MLVTREYSILAMKTRLQYWRERRFLSVRGLAKVAGVRPNTISDFERGKRKPRRETAEKLANALDITLDDLIDESATSNHAA